MKPHQSPFSITLILHIWLITLCIQCRCASINFTATDLSGESVKMPDFVECSPIYGDTLNGASCRKALDKIFPGLIIPRLVSVVKAKKGSSSTTLQVPFEYKDDDGS